MMPGTPAHSWIGFSKFPAQMKLLAFPQIRNVLEDVCKEEKIDVSENQLSEDMLEKTEWMKKNREELP